MQFILQIFTGVYFSQPVGMTVGQIRQRLREAMELIDVSDVILGLPLSDSSLANGFV